MGAGVGLPDGEFGLNVDAAHPVQRNQVELPHALVVFRRVAGGHDNPAFRHGLVAKGLALQELQHGGRQRFADAVDLVDEQNAVFLAGAFHGGIDTGNDLAHGVLGHTAGFAAVVPLPDKRQAHGTLPGMVGDGVGHQSNVALLGNLLHDLGFAHTRRSHQQDGTLAHRRNQRRAGIVTGQIGLYGMFDFLFGTLDVHGLSSFRLA